MIYSKIFELSGLKPTQLDKKLGLFTQQRLRYEKTNKIDLATVIRFANILEVSQSDVSRIIQDAIVELYKK